jgi:hypothetical protein
METYVDWKPHDIVEGECLECGFSFYTVERQMDLEEVNERRACYDLEPIGKLRDQTQEG